MRHDVSELENFPRVGSLPIEVPLVKKLSPDSLSVMEFKSDTDVIIARKMLQYPLLGEDSPKWPTIKLVREFDMTQSDGASLVHPTRTPKYEPLYEGKIIWQFQNNYAQPNFWIERKKLRSHLLGRTADNGQLLNCDVSRLIFRRQASSTNERTLTTPATIY